MLPAMLTWIAPRSLTAIAALGSLSGCAYGEMPQVLRAEAASETKCASLSVERASAYLPGYEENAWVVRGCGVDRIYTCKDKGGLVKFGKADCTYKDANQKPAAPAAPPLSPGDADPSPDEGAEDDTQGG
jgi:hypothetical protein